MRLRTWEPVCSGAGPAPVNWKFSGNTLEKVKEQQQAGFMDGSQHSCTQIRPRHVQGRFTDSSQTQWHQPPEPPQEGHEV